MNNNVRKLVINRWSDDTAIERDKVKVVVIDHIDFSGKTIAESINLLKTFEAEATKDCTMELGYDSEGECSEYYKLVVKTYESDYTYTKRCNNINARLETEYQQYLNLKEKWEGSASVA